jgi:hypothetical protein
MPLKYRQRLKEDLVRGQRWMTCLELESSLDEEMIVMMINGKQKQEEGPSRRPVLVDGPQASHSQSSVPRPVPLVVALSC